MAVALPDEITALIPIVAAELTGTDARKTQLAEQAVCNGYERAPGAPVVSLREAAIREAGYLADSKPALRSRRLKGPDGSEIEEQFNVHAGSNSFRASGAAAILAPYIVVGSGVAR